MAVAASLALLAPTTSWAASAAEPVTGALVAIGGGSEDPQLIQEILELAKGKASRVAILNTASSDPARSGPIYTRFFQSLGVTQVGVLPLLNRDHCYEPAVLDQIGQADLIYVTGGNQIRLAQTLMDTPAHGALAAAWQRGAIIAGTSAGAMVWGPSYLTAGSSAAALQRGAGAGANAGVELRGGLGIVPGVLVDTHFAREGRLGRLLVAAAQPPRLAGVGVDEDTAAVITADGVKALGAGRVTVLDVSRAAVPPQARTTFAVRNVEMHLLAAGDALRWRREEGSRTPMLPERAHEPAISPSIWLQGGDPVPPASWFQAGSGPFATGTGVFTRLPEEILILAGDGVTVSAQRWQAALTGAGRTTVRILTAAQLAGPLLQRYLTIAGGLVLLDDGPGTLSRALTGEQGALLRQYASKLQLASGGQAISMVGETAVKPGGAGHLVPGLRMAPGLIPAPDLWAPGAFDRLVVDALLAGGAVGLGLSSANGVRVEGGTLRVVGDAPVVVLETGKVSLANPAVPSARDLILHVLGPGEEYKL